LSLALQTLQHIGENPEKSVLEVDPVQTSLLVAQSLHCRQLFVGLKQRFYSLSDPSMVFQIGQGFPNR
jgi:hypothetical protein